MEKKDQEMRDLVDTQQKLTEINSLRKQEMKAIQDNIFNKKQTDAQDLKQKTVENETMKQDFQQEQIAVKQEKKNIVKAREEYAAKKLNAMKEKKMQEFKMQYKQRIQGEMDRLKNKETDIKRMEKLESELIEKLRNTQHMQKAAFAELESAIKYTSSGTQTANPEKK